ncbi:MAG: acyltransferase family protein [Acidovorax sp.]
MHRALPLPHLQKHPSYRADIDGLRCLAVLSVVAFHAAPEWIRGGFIGVDVFFVISGFLISSIIFSNLENDSFSLREFYARRVKRIFPALFVVLMATFAMGWYVLLSDEFAQLGKHLLAGAAFVSNLVLWNEAGYFDVAAETKPLLHLWSLGIEEQFYIVWPALLMLAWKRAGNLLTLTVVFAVISLALNIHGIAQDATATFYSPQTRFWELLCGSLLAWASLYPGAKAAALKRTLAHGLHRICFRTPPGGNEKILTHTLAMVGALLLVYGFFRIHSGLKFPGKWAIVPVLGTVLVIMAGPGAWFNRIVLSNRVAVWFGAISFPLYLWHWPLLAFARVMEGELPRWDIRLVAVVMAVALAWLTYRFIERPVRFGKSGRFTVATLCMLMAGVGLLGYITYRQQGFPSHLESGANQILLNDTSQPKAAFFTDGSCKKRLQLDTESDLVCLTNTNRPEVLVIGDSHAMALNSAALLGKVPVNTLLLGMSLCLPLTGYFVGTSPQDKRCNLLAERALSTLPRFPSVRTVLIAARGPLYFTGRGYGIEGPHTLSIFAADGSTSDRAEMFYKGYSSFVRELLKQGKNVIFVVDPPELGENPRGCFSGRPVSITEKPFSSCSQDLSKVMERQAQYRSLIQKIKKDNPQMEIYDPLSIFCDEARCYGLRAGRMLYWDDDHVSVRGSELVLGDMQKRGLLS